MSSKSKKKSESSEKKPGQEFAFQYRYKNNLPAVPFDPKLLKYPHGNDRLYKYFDSTILKSQKEQYIHPEGNQGLGCNPFELGYLERAMRNPGEKPVPRKDLLDSKDLALLVKPVERKAEVKHIPNVPWLHRTEYISTERSAFGRKKSGLEMGMSVKNQPQILNLLDLTVEQQIERIEKSFENAKKARLSTLKHPKFKDLQALELFPIFPDFENWPNPYFLASYDENPITDRLTDLPPDDQNMALEETLLKPLQDPENPEEDWLAYFTPTAETLEKIKLKRKLEELGRDVPEEDYEHEFIRDFDPTISNDELKYPFFIELRKDEGGAFYHPIQNQMKLKKRRAMSKFDAEVMENIKKPTRVVMRNRPLNENEIAERRKALETLLHREVGDEELGL